MGEHFFFECLQLIKKPENELEMTMPLTKTGKEVLKQMKKEYGAKKGEEVFYATMKEKGMEHE